MNHIVYTGDLENSYIDAILKEVYRDRVYDQFLLGKEDLITIDVGANIGLVSQYLSRFSKQVYSIEPSKQHARALSEMVKLNKIDNIKLVNIALSDKTGEKEFYHNNNVTMFSLNAAVQNGISEKVTTQTFADFFKIQQIEMVDFVKLDVEGSEFDVLGCESFAEVAPKIKSMLIEYHTWTNRNVMQLHEILRSHGFNTFSVPSEATLIGAVR